MILGIEAGSRAQSSGNRTWRFMGTYNYKSTYTLLRGLYGAYKHSYITPVVSLLIPYLEDFTGLEVQL